MPSDIRKELHVHQYPLSRARDAALNIANLLSKVEVTGGMVEEGLLSEDVFRSYAGRMKNEIKDDVAYIFTYLHLQDATSHFEQVFAKKEEANDADPNKPEGSDSSDRPSDPQPRSIPRLKTNTKSDKSKGKS